MRTDKSFKNLTAALVGQFFSILVTFVSRMVFVKYLSVEYLGINALFTNIIMILSLLELGIGPAIIYSLYKPLAEKDISKVKSLMVFYKKVYIIIGFLICIVGISITPFLDIIFKEVPSVPMISTIYILFILNASTSYFFSYKRSLIIADQNKYIATTYHYSFFVIMNIAQMIILFLTKNFIAFILIQLFTTILENIFISKKADKLYPFLKEKNIVPLDKSTLKGIYKNTMALISHRIGGVVVNSSDNIIISSYLGIIWVGLYSNYQLIVNALNTIIGHVFSSITASVGNLGVDDTEEKKLFIFEITYFINFWIYGFCSISLLILINPFIEIWLGESFLLSMLFIYILVINFYISGMRKSVLTFRDGFGLYWHDRYKPIFEVLVNLIVSIILVKKLGIVGVFIGTITSTLTTCFWIEPYILYKYGFNAPIKKYFLKYLMYATTVVLTGVVTIGISSLFMGTLYLSLLGKLIVCLVVPNLIFYLAFRKTKEYIYIKNMLLYLFNKYKLKFVNKS